MNRVRRLWFEKCYFITLSVFKCLTGRILTTIHAYHDNITQEINQQFVLQKYSKT